LRGDCHLGVIAGGFKFAIAKEEREVQLIGALDTGTQNRCTEAVEVASAGIEDQKALRGKHSGVEIGKGLREGAPGLVSSSQRIHRVRSADDFPSSVNERVNAFVEEQRADWARRCSL